MSQNVIRVMRICVTQPFEYQRSNNSGCDGIVHFAPTYNGLNDGSFFFFTIKQSAGTRELQLPCAPINLCASSIVQGSTKDVRHRVTRGSG